MVQPMPEGDRSQGGALGRAEGPINRRPGGRPALYYYARSPDAAAAATVAIVHGYGEYGGRYEHVMDAWAARGIASLAVDLRGHGRAQGRRGYCSHFDEYVDDVADFVRFVEERAPRDPLFLFGHSFGGLVSTCSVLRDHGLWRGLLLSAPYFGRALQVPTVKILAGKVTSVMVPTFALPTGFHGADVTRDAERARILDADPLCFDFATARWFTETELAQTRALAKAPSVMLPLYLVMGTADRIARLQTAREFFDAVGATDKTLDVRPGFFHEVLNEPEWTRVADAMASWILAHALESAVRPTAAV
jgi:alpha-beta hydrolase superfamily lysophospholipase